MSDPTQMGGVFDPSRPVALVGDLTITGALTGNKATAGIGYSAGAGGAVTQLTSKSTAVTLNKMCGTITMHAAQLNTVTSVQFTLNNSNIAALDTLVVNLASGNTAGSYFVSVDGVSAGSATISLRNYSGGNLSEAVVLNFVVIKSVAT